MGYSIELYFDEGFESRVTELWKRLEAFDVPSIMQTIGSKPHISLAVLDSVDEEDVSGILEIFASRLPPFEVDFPAYGLIPGPTHTVFLAPIVNAALIDVQKALYQQLQSFGFQPRTCYEPGHWLPHCTVSKELSPSDALKTVGICQDNFLTGSARAIELGFIEFRPRREIKTVSLISTTSPPAAKLLPI